MSMFHVGQRVVCIRGFDHIPQAAISIPSVGQVYTIRDVLLGTYYDGSRQYALVFQEFTNPPGPDGCECCFSPVCFRPVKDTSIEVFRKLLAPMPEKADA